MSRLTARNDCWISGRDRVQKRVSTSSHGGRGPGIQERHKRPFSGSTVHLLPFGAAGLDIEKIPAIRT